MEVEVDLVDDPPDAVPLHEHLAVILIQHRVESPPYLHGHRRSGGGHSEQAVCRTRKAPTEYKEHPQRPSRDAVMIMAARKKHPTDHFMCRRLWVASSGAMQPATPAKRTR